VAHGALGGNRTRIAYQGSAVPLLKGLLDVYVRLVKVDVNEDV